MLPTIQDLLLFIVTITNTSRHLHSVGVFSFVQLFNVLCPPIEEMFL